MLTKNRTVFLFVLLAVLALLTAFPAVATGGSNPTVVNGNPSCADLGYAFGYKPNPPAGEGNPTGTFNIDGFNTITVTENGAGTGIDWSSTLGIDAVIVKGGDNANLYTYDPEAFSGSGLVTPTNSNNGQPFGLSHVEFCYDYELTVTKDASTRFTRTYNWTISKSVDPAAIEMFRGDSRTANYTIQLTQNGSTDSAWAVTGNIYIANNTPFTATVTGVSDDVSGVNAPVTCPAASFTIDPGQTAACSYSTALPDGSSRTNTAAVTTTGQVGGGSGTAAVVFGSPTTEVNKNVSISDVSDAGTTGYGPFGGSQTITYSRTFTCNDDAGDHGNTATIVETGQNASANVHVNCYELTVQKTVDSTAYKRTYDWTITKEGDQTALTLTPGQPFTINYDVTVNASYTDSDFSASGTIRIYNPAPIPAPLTTVSDLAAGGFPGVVTCPQLVVPAAVPGQQLGVLTCTYTITGLPDATTRLNTATATLQNSPGGTTDFSGTANIDFSGATITTIDETASVTDTIAGALGSLNALTDALPKVYEYTHTVSYDLCGDYDVDNIATVTAGDTGTQDSASWHVDVTVPCGGGCTLTLGYWKTHSQYGPAPYDDTWAQVGEDTIFYLSGQSWYQVLWTAPQGNPYYILARQYIAAYINTLNGASTTPAVDAALASAVALFNTWTPANIPNDQRAAFVGAAMILDQYNNGDIGPGHCP